MAVKLSYAPVFLFPLTLAACGHDFGLQYYVDAAPSDSGLIEDSGLSWDEEEPSPSEEGKVGGCGSPSGS